jgi:polyisoprenoid-binding protein YceI
MTATNIENETTTWTIDPAHTEIGFAIRHLMIATVRGRFGAATGTVTIDPVDPKKSKVDVTIDVSSVDTRQEMRDNHLRSADFFDVAKYPTMHFVSKRIDGDVTRKFRVVGDLTIRGVTREITLEAVNEGNTKDPWGNERVGISATGKLNRGEFNLTWNQALETGGVMLGDEVKLSMDVELVRQAAAVGAAA